MRSHSANEHRYSGVTIFKMLKSRGHCAHALGISSGERLQGKPTFKLHDYWRGPYKSWWVDLCPLPNRIASLTMPPAITGLFHHRYTDSNNSRLSAMGFPLLDMWRLSNIHLCRVCMGLIILSFIKETSAGLNWFTDPFGGTIRRQFSSLHLIR